MRTTVVTPKEYEDIILGLVETVSFTNGKKPERFIRIMETNVGAVDMISPIPPEGDGLERKNPLIVALGDSVTAGRFEAAIPFEEIIKMAESGERKLLDTVDLRASYIDRFRYKLADKYEQTAVSIVNSGISGDTILGIERRLDRDALRYCPDLVTLNATLNWNAPECTDLTLFRDSTSRVLHRLCSETKADVVLMTPNAGIMPPIGPDNDLLLKERVGIVRELASEYDVCFVDIYKIWEEYENAGNPIEALLTNLTVHPTATGHEVYARALMKLFE